MQTKTVPFALFDSFSDTVLGGSQAAVISNAESISTDIRQKLAKEIGAPATCFIDHIDANTYTVQFFSTVTELPMCGHGTVGLMTRLDELGHIKWDNNAKAEVTLQLPRTTASIDMQRLENGRPLSMLEVRVPDFRADPFDADELARILGLSKDDFSGDLPQETAVADFVHLVVPLNDLNAMRKITPDFNAIVSFCHAVDVQTIAVFTREVENPDSTIHVRDFCPAVGVAESAAAGTTNAALAGYLVRNNLVPIDRNGDVHVLSEQGIEINRPSTIRTKATLRNETIATLKVGGIASKVLEGTLFLPDFTD